MFGLSTLQLLGAAIVAAFLLTGAGYVKGRMDGKSIGTVETLKAERDQLAERNDTDAEVDPMGRFDVCIDQLGSVPECEEFR